MNNSTDRNSLEQIELSIVKNFESKIISNIYLFFFFSFVFIVDRVSAVIFVLVISICSFRIVAARPMAKVVSTLNDNDQINDVLSS